jgi:hypothetical protein
LTKRKPNAASFVWYQTLINARHGGDCFSFLARLEGLATEKSKRSAARDFWSVATPGVLAIEKIQQ